MFSLFPSAYPQRTPTYYSPSNYSYLDRDYINALARERCEAQYRAQLEEARRRKAYQEQLARAEAARRRNAHIMSGFDDYEEPEPYYSFFNPRRQVSPRRRSPVRPEKSEELTQQVQPPVEEATPEPDLSHSTKPSTEREAELHLQTDNASSLTPDIRDASARKLQAFIRTHLPRMRAFRAIANISRQFETLKSAFQFPATLDFAPSDGPGQIPALLYTPKNAPLHGHEHELVRLLSKLDAVDSHGDIRIRKARKQLVNRIESELGALDLQKAAVWEGMARAAADAEGSPVESPKVVDSGYATEDNAEDASHSLDSLSMDVDRLSSSLNVESGEGEMREEVEVEGVLVTGPEESTEISEEVEKSQMESEAHSEQ